MKLLLDTHAALWWLDGDPRLGAEALRQAGDPANEVFLSAVVVWEIAIKRSLGKLEAPDGIARTLLDAGARPLPVGLDHAAEVEGLPRHHGDRFDRLLIAQARIEGAAVVTQDDTIGRYGVPIVW